MLELAAFLGNPGPLHAGNRHNIGWHLLQRLPFYEQLSWRKKFKGLWADFENAALLRFCGEQEQPDNENQGSDLPGNEISGSKSLPAKIHFLKPETYMNRSGDSVFAAASFFKIKPENIIVIHDELELELGTISLKFGGGLGGHNGLRSMKASFGTADFWRLRIGIGRPDSRLPGEGGREGSGRGIVEWVLSDFEAEESAALEPVLQTAAELLVKTIVRGPGAFLPEWAKKRMV